MAIFLIFSLVLVIIFISLILYLRWNFNYWRKRGVLGPEPLLWYGTFKKSAFKECDFIEELNEIYKKYKSSQNYVGVFTARTPRLYILDPMLAKKILTTDFKNVRTNESSKWAHPGVDLLRTNSPFVTTGEKWKEKRAELVPVLTPGRLRVVHENLKESAKKLTQYIERHLNETMATKELINRYTADFMASFIWGVKTHIDAFDENSFSDVHKMAEKMLSQSDQCLRYYTRTENFPWLRKMFPVRFFHKDSDEFFKQLTDYAINMRAEMIKKTDSFVGESTDVINHLLQLRNKKSLNKEQIAGHTTTILIDGFETIAIATAHLLLLLARNPRVQKKLRDELETFNLKECNYDELNNLEYLDMCVNESLRLFPPLTGLFKICTEALTVENKDGSTLEIEPDIGVYITSFSFHHDGDFYEDPESFWPERFSPEMGGIRKYQEMGVFLPFGDGPRICPGMKLGIAEIKMATASIVKRFIIKLGPNMRLDNKLAVGAFQLGIDGGIRLEFEEI